MATPANLTQFIADTRLTNLRLCFDAGHAHLAGGVLPGFDTMRDLVVSAHIHDNHGEKDEHLVPYEGTIDWRAALAALVPAPGAPTDVPTAMRAGQVLSRDIPLVLELKEQPAYADPAPPSLALDAVRSTFDRIESELEALVRD